jgi:hypothetical protein
MKVSGAKLAQHRPTTTYPVVAMKRGEYFCSFTIGPIMKETFTRVAFVHTNFATRVLSMETGQEIKTSMFPHESTLDSFRPILMATCSSQRVIAHADPKDTRLSVKIFTHANDGKTDEELEQQSLVSPQVIHGLRRSASQLRKIAVETVLTTKPLPDDSTRTALIEGRNFIKYIWETFSLVTDRLEVDKRRVDVTEGLFGATTELGVIQPTEWPPYDRIEKYIKDITTNSDGDEEDSDDEGGEVHDDNKLQVAAEGVPIIIPESPGVRNETERTVSTDDVDNEKPLAVYRNVLGPYTKWNPNCSVDSTWDVDHDLIDIDKAANDPALNMVIVEELKHRGGSAISIELERQAATLDSSSSSSSSSRKVLLVSDKDKVRPVEEEKTEPSQTTIAGSSAAGSNSAGKDEVLRTVDNNMDEIEHIDIDEK